jgi:hypothetical protein
MTDPSRRRILRHAAALPVLAVLPLSTRAETTRAGSGEKSDFHYQDHPNEGNRCVNCTAFIPPAEGGKPGQCRIVAGPVTQDGWCMAFSPK